jgi:hypothetical protein
MLYAFYLIHAWLSRSLYGTAQRLNQSGIKPVLLGLVLTLLVLVPVRAGTPSPSSQPTTRMAKKTITKKTGTPSPTTQPTTAPQIVPGKDVPHWSGLPIWGQAECDKLGFDGPLPIGLSCIYFAEKESFYMPNLKLGRQGLGMLNAGGLVRVPDIKISENAKILRLDAWTLPFLDLYGLVGDVSGHANVDIEPAFIPHKVSPKYDLRLDYEGPTVGLGGTLAGGVKPFKARQTTLFGMADFNVSETFLDFKRVVTSLDPVTVAVLNLRGGVRERIRRTSSVGDIYLSVWGGAMWEDVQKIMPGSVSILDLDFQGTVKSANQWNPVVGAGLEIGKHVNLMFDVGFGQRKSVMLAATFRF